jgi:WD domain, G-beta repeat/Anaphase-promoting complex subunit 4 WD40 domain
MSKRLVAPGVSGDVMEQLISPADSTALVPVASAPSGAASGGATQQHPFGVLSLVTSWSPPAAYGGLQDKLRVKQKKGQQVIPNQISSDNFVSFSQLPVQPSDAPQRAAAAARYRSDRKLRVPVSAKNPPCVGVINSVNGGIPGAGTAGNIRAMAVNNEGNQVFIATEQDAFLWYASPQPQLVGIEPEQRIYADLFCPFSVLPHNEPILPGLAAPPQPSIPPSIRTICNNSCLAADFSPDSPLLITAGMNGQLLLYSQEIGAPLVSYLGHSSRVPVWNVKWSPAGTYFASGAGDGTARLWRTDIVASLRLMVHDHGKHVQILDWHPNCQVIASATEEEFTVWDVVSPHKIFSIPKLYVNDLSFSPTGQFLAVASDSGLDVFDVTSQKLVYKSRQNDPILNVAWSWPTNQGISDDCILQHNANPSSGYPHLVTVEGDGTCRLYDKLVNERPSICELPLERKIRPFTAKFTWKNFLVVAGVDINGDIQI